jgi:hypothetical protein
MQYLLLLSIILPKTLLGDTFIQPFLHFVQHRLCNSVQLQGLISDCSCDFGSVDTSVTKFFSPILANITSRTFFRYFRVDLEKPCPFWHEDGQCMMEACSVCSCEENEVPRSWVDITTSVNMNNEVESKDQNGDSFGWITSPNSAYGFIDGHSDILGRVNMSAPLAKVPDQLAFDDPYVKYLRETEDESTYSDIGSNYFNQIISNYYLMISSSV